MKKTVAMIPIKLNNLRLPGKNTMQLGKKVLCEYLFETLGSVNSIDECYVFCSDETICRYIPKGIRFLKRPAQLDSDTVKSKDLLDWFISQVEADVYALLHVTQPFIKAASIDKMVEAVQQGEYDSAFAAEEIKEFAWFKGQPVNYSFENVVRTQELEPVYVEAEAFIFLREVLTVHGRRIGFRPYIHPIDSLENICIDTKEDFELAKAAVMLMESKIKPAGEGIA